MRRTSITARVEEARNLMQEYQKANQISNAIFWVKAKYSYLLKTNSLWKYAVGEGTGTWGAFCAEILKTPVSTVDQRVATYQFFVMKHKMDTLDLQKYDSYALYYIASYSKESSKEEVEQRLTDSLDMGRRDLLMTLQGKTECEHELGEKNVKICVKCNRRLK